MPGETDLHKRLKEAACWWLWNQGLRAVAAEVRLPGIGIVDAAAAGRPLGDFRRLPTAPWARPPFKSRRIDWQSVIVECKASRSDFQRDAAQPDPLRAVIEERAVAGTLRTRRTHHRAHPPLGKFALCLARPVANWHWLLTPARLIDRRELPPRWGLLELDEHGVRMVHPPAYQLSAGTGWVEAAIARTLSASIYAADTRATINSVNRLLRGKQLASSQRMVRDLERFADSW